MQRSKNVSRQSELCHVLSVPATVHRGPKNRTFPCVDMISSTFVCLIQISVFSVSWATCRFSSLKTVRGTQGSSLVVFNGPRCDDRRLSKEEREKEKYDVSSAWSCISQIGRGWRCLLLSKELLIFQSVHTMRPLPLYRGARVLILNPLLNVSPCFYSLPCVNAIDLNVQWICFSSLRQVFTTPVFIIVALAAA